MKLIQRLVPQLSDKLMNTILQSHAQYPDSFDTVWLTTLFGYPRQEEHRKQAQKLRAAAKTLRENGISVSLQLANSIGHGQYTSQYDCSGLVGKAGVEPLVGHDGRVAPYCFCWNGEAFRSYLLEGIELYAKEIRPDYFWIDDDFRADNHAPVQYGCFCPSCIAKFNEKHRKAYTREQLVDALLHESDAETRQLWMNFVKEHLADLMKQICQAVERQSPQTVTCLQNGIHGYLGYGLDSVFDAMYEATGKAPWYRPGGGAYSDHNPNKIINKMVDVTYQRASAPSYVTHFAPEIENIPHYYSGKSAAGTAFETSVYLASGATDMTYSMLGELSEASDFYEEFFALFAQQRDYLEKLASLSEIGKGGGFSYAISKQFYLRELGENATIRDYGVEHFHSSDLLLRSGMPITFDHADGAPYLLHPDVAETLSDAEIEALLAGRVLTDGESIAILKKRGYFKEMEVQAVADDDALRLSERYLPHRITDGATQKTFQPSYFSAGGRTTYTFRKVPSNAEIIGVYENVSPLERFFESNDAPYGVSSFLLQTEQGGKLAVFGTGMWVGNIPFERMKLLLRAGDAIAEKPLPAIPVSAKQILLLPKVTSDNQRTLAVSVANLTIGPLRGARILVRRAVGTPLVYGQYLQPTRINALPTDDGLLLELPEIAPYSLATVFFEQEEPTVAKK